jgi:hypothetical protein
MCLLPLQTSKGQTNIRPWYIVREAFKRGVQAKVLAFQAPFGRAFARASTKPGHLRVCLHWVSSVRNCILCSEHRHFIQLLSPEP